MIELLGVVAVMSLVFGVVVDDEFYRLANTCANFATVLLVVWHSRHVRRQIEPGVKDTAAVIKRQLGERQPLDPDQDPDATDAPDKYHGPERRK